MATPSGRHGIIRVAEHVQQLSNADPSAVERVARDVQAALAEQGPGRSTQQPQAPEQQGDTAACIIAAVQCAGWLVQAASHEQHVGPAMCAAQLCIQKATRWLDRRLMFGDYPLDLLRAVEHPGGNIPGVALAHVGNSAWCQVSEKAACRRHPVHPTHA
jgi:hypothetical protein